MPSRKKAKGKARKAAKEAKESQAAVEVAAGQQLVREKTLEARMERLKISAASPAMCRHGYPQVSPDNCKVCCDFIDAFIAAFLSQDSCNFKDQFTTATKATAEEYAEVYSSKLDTVISSLLFGGTRHILNGDSRKAQLFAFLACYFEDFMAIGVHKTKATLRSTKLAELSSADDHTLVSFYRKRIPCDCLDEKYKEVKSIKKMGRCVNLYCSHPDGRVERSKMFSCTRCGVANYCSVECQKVDWKDHRVQCDHAAKMKARFDSKQS